MAVPLQGFPRPTQYYDPGNEAQFRAAVDASIAALDSAITEGVDLITANITFDGGVTFDGATDFNAASTFDAGVTFNGTVTLVGDVTAANVDFSGNVTFTGATTVPEATVTAHQAALAIAFSQLTGSIANGQVPQSAVTQHQAALAIAESQITDGSILARLAAAETVSGAWTFDSTRIGQTAHALVALDAAADFAQPSGYRTMASNASVEMPPGWNSYYHWQVMSRRDSGGGYVGLAFAHGDGEMWFGENIDGTALPNWHRVLTEATNAFSGETMEWTAAGGDVTFAADVIATV